jgi:hypothetical protein
MVVMLQHMHGHKHDHHSFPLHQNHMQQLDEPFFIEKKNKDFSMEENF